jgi:cell division protein ZapA
MADTLIPVNIVIGDRTYRIKIRPEDEEPVRNTIKLINDKIIEFKTQFSAKDMQDYIAMVLVWYATEQSHHTKSNLDEGALVEKLTQIEGMLDKMI